MVVDSGFFCCSGFVAVVAGSCFGVGCGLGGLGGWEAAFCCSGELVGLTTAAVCGG